MTWSPETRRKNIDLALRLMLEHLGDRACGHVILEPRVPPLDVIAPTTWDDMEDQGLVRPSFRYYLLTGLGWLTAVELTGQLDDEFKRRLGKLNAFLSSKLEDGRPENGLAELPEVVRRTGLPEGWVFNAIDSRVRARLYGETEAYWHRDDPRKNIIDIPRRFGMKCL